MSKRPRVLLIYTGGTIGMVSDPRNGALRAMDLEHLEEQVPELHVSASEQSDGTVLVTAANLNDTEPVPVNCLLGGIHAAGVTARVLAGAPFDHNTFDRPEAVRPAPLAVTPTETGFTAVLPPCSVAAFTVCQK